MLSQGTVPLACRQGGLCPEHTGPVRLDGAFLEHSLIKHVTRQRTTFWSNRSIPFIPYIAAHTLQKFLSNVCHIQSSNPWGSLATPDRFWLR
ncbi:Uncharacterized protein HZ326_31107 [Fusarium oxysporum f. sp. albedinis]|nr:Uncharacterized protein HZ326_31107 [Fusarium oxysporum f. sp. albedinis]